MKETSTDKFVVELIDYLIARGVGNTQNGLIHALAIWLENKIQGKFVEKRKQEAAAYFHEFVVKFVRLKQTQYQRKEWNEDRVVSPGKDEWETSLEISSKILGRMKGMSLDQGLEFILDIYMTM